MKPRKDASDDRTQSERFIEAARELGCDETEEGFAEIVRKVAKAPPGSPIKAPARRTVAKRRSPDHLP